MKTTKSIITSLGLAVLAGASLVTPAHANLIIGNSPGDSAGYRFYLSETNKEAVGITMSASFDHITFSAMLNNSWTNATAGIYSNSNTPDLYSKHSGAFPGELLLSIEPVLLTGPNGFSSYEFIADPSFVLNSGSTYYFMLSGNSVEWAVDSANDNFGATPVSPGTVATSALIGSRWISSGDNNYDSRTPSFELGGVALTAVPEVTSSFTLLGLIGSGLLLRRRGKNVSPTR
ncbi:MAG: hypothetical protein WCK77_06920 [Verrucomicrobiota bacterium]